MSKVWKKNTMEYENCGLALYTGDQENLWYMYGCSNNMTNDKYKFMSFNEIKKEKDVTFLNNSPVVIKGKGIVLLKEKFKAGNVLFIDGLKHNLLGVSHICDQVNEVVFRSNNFVVQNLDTRKQ